MRVGELPRSGLKVAVQRIEHSDQPDATALAALAADQALQRERDKQERLHNFNESVRLNATRLSKQNNRKGDIQKQKKESQKLTSSQVRQKYTFKSLKKEKKNEWKKAVDLKPAIIIPADDECRQESDSDTDRSVMDSDWQGEQQGESQVVTRFESLRQKLKLAKHKFQ